MIRAKLCLGAVTLGLLALVVGGCASESAPPVETAADARDAAIAYLQEHDVHNAPGPGIDWQEQDATPLGVMGAVTKQFISDEWATKVSYAVVLPENTLYRVVVSSIKLGWHWEGTVKYDASVAEISAFKQMSQQESEAIADEFVKNSPTFAFDGMEDSLTLTGTLTARCPYCWVFIFEFDSRHAGYGDRTGQAFAEAITPHRAVISVEQLEITSATVDNKWDIFGQTMIIDEGVSKIYLASPLGFAESTQDFMAVIESQIAACGYVVLNPWHLATSRQSEFEAASLIESDDQRRQALHKVNMEVASGNEKAIRECQLVVAVLDGSEVGSGTASEIGFAYALGKRIYGYRSDFRLAGDNEGCIINLQIDYWIENSGGCIVRNLDELRQELARAAIM